MLTAWSLLWLIGCRYYPKLQVCVPFTPATGNRLLVKPGPLSAVVFKALAQTLVTLTGVTQLGCVRWSSPYQAHIAAHTYMHAALLHTANQ